MPLRRTSAISIAVFCFITLGAPIPARAQDYLRSLSPEAIANLIASAQPDTPVPLTVANRTITELRAGILGRSSTDRAAAAAALITTIAADGQRHVATSRELATAAVISVDGRDVFAIMPADANELVSELVAAKAATAVTRLQLALDELAESRRPQLLLWGVVQAVAVTVLFAVVLLLLVRVNRGATAAVARATERQLARLISGDELVRRTNILQYVRRSISLVLLLLAITVGYLWFTFVLRRFPYTRPWGESMRALLIDRVSAFGQNALAYLPDLFSVVLILFAARLLVRLLHLVFVNVEEQRVTLLGVYPETAATTRKLLTALLWVFALVVAYPYLPGSNTDAFKGVSVFVGLMISLGSSGLINQVMSGFTLTYSRALRRGDYVRVGDVEGTVTHIGTLSTKLETPRREEITIPNAVMVSQRVINYSRHSVAGVFMPTQVTIGYDAPWRKVEALLLSAAAATDGVRQEPPPMVFQTALQDFYVEYTLLVCLTEQARRGLIFDRLHANIQDCFNEGGVQIMSPHYEADPDGTKIVPKAKWYA
ncbi:MAG: mechanosensitive ion channel family protein [Vicinamibacterales bacterium]